MGLNEHFLSIIVPYFWDSIPDLISHSFSFLTDELLLLYIIQFFCSLGFSVFSPSSIGSAFSDEYSDLRNNFWGSLSYPISSSFLSHSLTKQKPGSPDETASNTPIYPVLFVAQLLKFAVLHIFPMFIYFFLKARGFYCSITAKESRPMRQFLSLFFKRKVRHKETKQFAQACAVELFWDFMIFDCKLRLLKSISVTYNQTFTQDNLIFANYRGRKSARVCIKHVALKMTGSLWPCACSELDMKVPREPCLRDEDWKCYSWPFGGHRTDLQRLQLWQVLASNRNLIWLFSALWKISVFWAQTIYPNSGKGLQFTLYAELCMVFS